MTAWGESSESERCAELSACAEVPPRKSGPADARRAKETTWAIKKHDGDPILRHDISASAMEAIFSDRTFLFTAPVDQTSPPADPIYLNFDQLYLEAILSGTKTTGNLRNKLIENPQFAISFCKVALLVNVGRINTTLAFYPSMKTALRTYHPIPSLQMDEISRRDMQDAPRIKGILKACFLDWELSQQPTCLKDIAKKAASEELTRGPPTTVVTAIFNLFNEVNFVSEKYFPPGFDLLDIFYPSDLSASSRATAFLSVLHRVLEQRSASLDDHNTPGKVTLDPPLSLTRLTPSDPKEDVDTPEELLYAAEVKEFRNGVVKTVPAIVKREQEIAEKESKQAEKDRIQEEREAGGGAFLGGAGAAGGGTPVPGAKRRRVGGHAPASFARTESLKRQALNPDILTDGWEDEDWSHDVPKVKSLPATWRKVKEDLLSNRDPDYDSDEEPWTYDSLLQRRTITVLNTATGQRGAPSIVHPKLYEEWLKRKEGGGVDDDEDGSVFPGYDLERGAGVLGSEMGDE